MPRSANPRKNRVRRPRQARSRATVDAIVEAAARVLARRGWARLTTNAVADKAGVSIGTLYEYFRNKEALANAVLERHIARGEALLADRLRPFKDNGPPIDALVDSLVDGFVSLHADDPVLHRRLSSEVPISPAVAKRVGALTNTLVDALAAALRRHPDVHIADAKLSARLMVDAVDALTHRWVVDGEAPVDADVMASELSQMLRRYLGL